MLDWSLIDLARAAGVSVMTARNVEGRAPDTSPAVARFAIRDAFIAAGIRFLVDDGEGAGLRLAAARRAASAR